MKTISSEQFKKTYGEAGADLTPTIPPSKSFLDNIKTDLAKRGENVFKQSERNQTVASDVLQFLGQGAGFVGDIATEGIKKVGEVTGATEAIKPVAIDLLNTSVGKAGLEAIKGGAEVYNSWKESNPEIAANLEAIINIGSILPLGKAGQIAGKTALNTVEGAIDIGAKGLKVIEPVLDTTKSLATGVKDVASMTLEGASNIPSRIATNVAEKQAIRQSIKELPTEIAKKAVQDGIDINDVKYIYQIPKDQKEPLRKLLKSVKDFDSGVSKTNPIETVGEPIVKRVKTLESEAGKIGKELGDVAGTLGNVTKEEALSPVLNKLKEIRGLEGLSIDEKGLLNFKDTVLSTIETASDRKAIQSIFKQAVQDGTGKQKHLLRQELFEILGGKKKSGVAITDTQDKAYQAIRQGLSDVLDTKNTKYKSLNLEYAKIANPLSDLRRILKTVNADEDIANMSAGLLARRITSMAKSNPEIRNILRNMDNATKVKGDTSSSIENLQDFYNLLDKYYNIEGKTSLQGQVKTGIEKVSGLRDAIGQTVGELAGKTEAVKRKAIEQALEESLR